MNATEAVKLTILAQIKRTAEFGLSETKYYFDSNSRFANNTYDLMNELSSLGYSVQNGSEWNNGMEHKFLSISWK